MDLFLIFEIVLSSPKATLQTTILVPNLITLIFCRITVLFKMKTDRLFDETIEFPKNHSSEAIQETMYTKILMCNESYKQCIKISALYIQIVWPFVNRFHSRWMCHFWRLHRVSRGHKPWILHYFQNLRYDLSTASTKKIFTRWIDFLT